MSEPTTPLTRLVFADAIKTGHIIIVASCGLPCAGTSGIHAHQLVVMDLRVSEGIVHAITMDETGEQRPWSTRVPIPVRILADAARTEPTR